MNNNFIKEGINIKEKLKEGRPNICLLTNNERQIDDICDFLQSDNKLMLINGFAGTGKSDIVDFVTENFNPNVLLIKYTCFETTILDDMLLSFFETFRNLAIEGKIVPPRVKVDNFTQKINTYFNSVNSPIVIVLSSFQTILKENKQEILNFIEHLSKFENIKIIITSRSFNYDDFASVKYDRTSVLALSKDNFEKFLRDNNIKNIGPLSNELYKQTRGYYHYVNLSVKISNLRQWNLGKLLEMFSKSMGTYFEFILKEAILIVDPVSLHLFRLLALMRIPIHRNLLKSLHLYDEERIEFFISNSILSKDGESVYLKDYYREIIEGQIQDSVMLKLHKACVDLYETQLPLKPLERDLRLSRQTMRNEIEYHSLFIPQKPQTIISQIPQTQILPQIKFIPQEEKQVQKEQIPEETKEEKIEKINFIFEDETILNNIADSIKDFVIEKSENSEFITNNSNMSLVDLLNSAKEEENKYNYRHAVMLYQMALNKKDDDNFDKLLPKIYISLAKVYKQLSDWYNTIEYYTKAQDYYYNISDEEKVCAIKLEIAYIYFIMYKQDNAKYILHELETKENISDELKIRINLALGKISDNIKDEFSYYKKCIELISSKTDKSLCAESYYRFAGVNDEKDNVTEAVKYYKKCIEITKNNNYLSRALANLAQLCDESHKPEYAIKYYEQSIEIDKNLKNYNGLYTSERSLSEIYSSKDSNKSLEHLLKAHEYAKQLNEPYYMSDSASEIGNYYLLRKDFENAYKYFIEAYQTAKNSSSKDNSEKLLSKIDYLKLFVKEEKFKEFQGKYGK